MRERKVGTNGAIMDCMKWLPCSTMPLLGSSLAGGVVVATRPGYALILISETTKITPTKMNNYSNKIQAIINATAQAGEDAYLWLQDDAGDCILWPSEDSSVNDAGANAIGRWTLTEEEIAELEEADTEGDVNISGRN